MRKIKCHGKELIEIRRNSLRDFSRVDSNEFHYLARSRTITDAGRESQNGNRTSLVARPF